MSMLLSFFCVMKSAIGLFGSIRVFCDELNKAFFKQYN